MGLFDEIVSNAKTVASSVGKKADQIVDFSKLKYAESGIKSEIAKKKQELGDYVYQCSGVGDIDQAKTQAIINEIKELEQNLEVTREMIIAARNKVVCDFCKAENDKESMFCSKCGSKLVIKEECCCGNCEEDVTVAASSSVDDVTSEPIEVETEKETVVETTVNEVTEDSVD
ncbi:MAG: zinc ribbon domain-containing protein [Acutalibacteraceae bacterium]|nr:zinc ribbon domain-containing protein [Acutalibacteraceae bacterium]